MLPAGPLVPRRYLSIFCFVCAPFMLMISSWALLTDEIGAVERGCGLATISAMVLYMCGLPRLHRHLPSPGRRLIRAALLLGNLFFTGWPLVLLSISLGIVPLRLGITVEMMIGAAYVAGFATWLGYAVQGQSAPTGSGSEAVACE